MSNPSLAATLRAASPQLSAGLLSADLMNLRESLGQLEEASIQVLHFDIMDGLLVPEMTAGPPFVAAAETSLVKDVHLLVRHPVELIPACLDSGADIVTVHVESENDPLEVWEAMDRYQEDRQGRPCLRGVGLFPSTPIHALRRALPECDMVTVLAIDPRTGEGMDIQATLERVDALRLLLSRARANCLVAIDGGITASNIEAIAAAGADLVVSGSALFRDEGPAVNVPLMTSALVSQKK